MRKLLVPILCLAAWGCSSEGPEAGEVQRFHGLVEQYFADFLKMHPIQATQLGFHSYDHLMGGYSANAIADETAYMKSTLAQLGNFQDDSLDVSSRRDRLILQNSIRDQLIELEEYPVWKKNPNFYNDLLMTGILQLIERGAVPKSERLRLVIERERQIPALLETAKANLDEPPRGFTEIAIEQFKTTLFFFQDVVPRAFEDTPATELIGELKVENRKVIEACADFILFLEQELLPKSTPAFALGEEWLQKKLRYREMIELPIASIEERVVQRLKQVQSEAAGAAKRVDAGKPLSEILELMTRDRPTAEQLIPTIRGLLEEMRAFCIRKNLVTIPSEVRCQVTETPPFARTLNLGALDTPGAYEPIPQEAYFKITLPDSAWSPDRREGHLRFFNYAALPAVSAFETYPGKYLLHLWSKTVASKVRRMLPSDFFISGWGHYSEQLVVDEGYGGGNPKVLLAQQRNALLRLARVLTAIRMHTGRMTPDQAAQFFMREAYQDRGSAVRETTRAILNPIHAMAYAWGKLELLRLREDYRQRQGSTFSLKEFHNDVLRLGAPPIPLLRQILFERLETAAASN